MSHGSSEDGNPDLTAMLDMVFQLVTFFMLVINFKAASMDLDLKLPVVGSARPVDTKGAKELLVLNVNAKGELKIFGMVKKDIDNYIAGEAVASRLAAKKKNSDFKDDDELPDKVVVRADRATKFKMLNRVIKACQDNGYRNFAMKAMDKDES